VGAGCAGNTQTLTELTFGLNWTMLSGRFGTPRSGLQYNNIVRTAYAGEGGTPSAAENLFMFNSATFRSSDGRTGVDCGLRIAVHKVAGAR
jgi:hypothetical protein